MTTADPAGVPPMDVTAKSNRLQHYFQYQVILKPSPDNVQDIYLKSLTALGIKAEDHDIRFVEDNWESPTLGAWGVGWEVGWTAWK